jgi:hypothetical protein
MTTLSGNFSMALASEATSSMDAVASTGGAALQDPESGSSAGPAPPVRLRDRSRPFSRHPISLLSDNSGSDVGCDLVAQARTIPVAVPPSTQREPPPDCSHSGPDTAAWAAPTLFDALGVQRKQLVKFTAAEGAGGHCEATARRLFHQRVYDWFDETLSST